MEKTSKVVLATATVLLSVNAMTFGQTPAVKAATTKVQTTPAVKVSPVVKAQVETKVNAGGVQNKDPFAKAPDTHSQSGGFSKFSKPTDMDAAKTKVNVKAAAAKAKAKVN
jgi:hypothetical protein